MLIYVKQYFDILVNYQEIIDNMKRKVVLKDIAEKTGYTINTVARALRDKEDIAKTTINLIKLTAEEMGYIPNATASALRSGSTKTVAVILPDVSNPSFGILMKDLEIMLGELGYTVFIMNTDEESKKEKQAIVSALSKNVDGIIFCPAQQSSKSIELLNNSHIPYVLVGRYFDNKSDCVIVDNVHGAFLAIEHLIQKGHKEILFLNGPTYNTSSIERLEGYKKAFTRYNITYIEKLIKEIDITSGDVYKVLAKLKKNKVKFSAIFTFSDLIAWETIGALKKMELKVPEDIAVVGFDNIQSHFPYPYPLTTVDYQKKESSKLLIEILLKKINKKYNSTKHIYTVKTSLIVRNST